MPGSSLTPRHEQLSAIRASLAGALVVQLLLAPIVVDAQQAGKVYRIGHLSIMPRDAMAPYVDALESGLRDLGYVSGRNVVIEHRSANGRPERFPDLAAELVRLNVDVVVTGMDSGIVALKQATTTIPIVMVYGIDPVGQKFIDSLPRPGGNITGGTFDPTPDIYSKRLGILKEVVPRFERVAFLWNPAFPGGATYLQATRDYARQLAVRVQSVEVRGPGELESAFASMAKQRAQAVVVLSEPMTFTARGQIGDLATRYRLPVIASTREFADAGALMSYGPNLLDRWRHAAVYVDKILRGVRPRDLPVEQPTTFELAINMKTAKTLGLAIPRPVLVQANHVIH